MVAPHPRTLHSSPIERHECSPQRLVTSPVEASFRLDASPDADAVPDLVASTAESPPPASPHPEPTRGQPQFYATFPQRGAARPRLAPDTFAHATPHAPVPLGMGGVSMVRSVSQPVLTGAEHAQYTASRAASLGRIAGAHAGVSEGPGGRARPALFGALTRLEDGDEEGPRVAAVAAVDIEMPEVAERPRTRELSLPPSYLRSRSYVEAPRPSTAGNFIPRPDESLCSLAPRTPSPITASRMASSLHPAYAPRTPSPVSTTSRLTPTSGARVRPAHHGAVGGSPTPSTTARAAAWRARAGLRCVRKFKVEEAV